MHTVNNYDFETEPTAPLLHHLVDEVAHRYPEQIAVVYGALSLTYRQLVTQANALAQTILHRDAASPFVGISTTRDLSMIVGVLAILKAGKAYLPLDPAYPVARLKQIADSAGIRTVLLTKADDPSLATLPLQRLYRNQNYPVSRPLTAQQNSTAYVLFTSGSTGTPKGVCLGHGALVNLLTWQKSQSQASVGTRTLQFAPLTFDVSFQEIFATLSTGGTLVLIDDSQRLDLNGLLPFIAEQQISRLFLPFVALQYLAEAAVTTNVFPASLREVMTAGEQLKVTPQVATFFAGIPGCILFNQYGPTECHVVTQLRLDGDPATWPALPGIGSPIDHVRVHVLTDQLKPVPEGEVGELCFSGACLAEGYLNQPTLTAEKFMYLSLSADAQPVKIYRTGDLGRLLPDGSIDFQGRRDDQVKIRGHRIELGEIEVVLNQTPGIRQAVVLARTSVAGQQLVAYLVSTDGQTDTLSVRNAIDQRLPDYMLPSAFVWLDDFPKTSSGKVDKKRLPAPERKRPESLGPYRKPRTELEKTLERIWVSLLELDIAGLDDNFFELGGNSLLAQKTVAGLKQENLTLPITKLYQFPTIAGVANYLQPAPDTTKRVQPSQIKPSADTSSDIAVIGMAGRFPGAATIDELWHVLSQGIETVRFFTDEELDSTIPGDLRNDPRYVKARGVLDGADQFDPAFFGIPPAIAQLMDPQQRVFLEISWETLEQTGHLPVHYDGRVGVFAGCGNNSYFLNNVQSNKALVDQVGAFQVMTLNEKDYIASRTAYQLNVKGPAVSVYSACSTSLLAITQAVQSIRNGQCDVALAGGASITAPINSGHLYQEGAMLSRDGHCRSFDAQAQGTTFSDGAGVVLLKDAAAARRDGDTVYAVIKGVGINNDGGGKGSFTAPSAEGQAGSIAMAIADAAIDPATISYVEAHGTATPLGDPIEIDGLTMAFGEQERKQFCAIGSIKSNMGHLTAASGVAGLIKTALALHHRQIPPSLGFTTPNPAIDFANSPFFVNTRLTNWPSSSETSDKEDTTTPRRTNPRRAGVSSFGVGGTNVHVILEEFVPATPKIQVTPEPVTSGRAMQLVTWSAKTVASRDAYAHKLASALPQTGNLQLADVAFTLQTTRAPFRHRRFAVADTTSDLLNQLAAAPTATNTNPIGLTTPDEIVFLFPGQGAQYLNMGRALYEHEVVFRKAVDHCATLLTDYLDLDIRQVLYSPKTDPEAELRLKNTRYTQPALFVTEYALASLWMSWGIEPSVFCGHSVGEFVAAHLAGVLSLADALKLIAIRGKLVSELPRGSMLSVRQRAELVQPMMPDTLSMAAANSRNLCVVAGPDEHIADFARLLDERSIPNRLLMTSHAFHSTMMDPVVGTFTAAVREIRLNRPQKPIVSTLTGTWMTDADATDPAYWGRHLRETVRFADALDTLFTLDNPLLIDLGPGRGLATLARQQAGKKAVPVFTGLVDQLDWSACSQALLTTLGQLYVHGLTPNWQAFYAGQQRQRVRLPTYAFERKRCWVDPANPDPLRTEPIEPTTTLPTTPLFQPTTNPAISTQPPLVTMRTTSLIGQINDLIETASGLDMADVTPDMSFLEIGLDSLLLTQVALTLKKEFNVPITFRQLTNEFTSPALLADYLDQQLPAEVAPPVTASVAPSVAAVPVATPSPVYTTAPVSVPVVPVSADGDSALSLIAQQMQLLARQIALLQAASPATAPVYTAPPAPAPVQTPVPTAVSSPAPKQPQFSTPDITAEEAIELKKPFGATARIERQSTTLTSRQQALLERIIDRYTKKTARSKAYAQKHRAQMADPRVVSGFRPLTKEIVYPLVVDRSKGSHLWDIDGNEYIDALNGFGSNMFGYQPDLIKKALLDQIEDGYEIGPQHPLAGEVSDLICELTGNDRAALCNTGSEAVLGAMRIARTVTGRSLIVAFAGSYHGIVDEVIVRGTKKLKSFPAAPGIMPEAVQNMLILDYGTDETLAIIRERANELAAVLVEPVQSRRPEFVPIDFLKEVRSITAQSGTALIFDEVITGFRMHPGGAQALFGVKADLATYGKVVGAGISIGVIAGKRAFMDALDGGFWQYGDSSVPEVGVTYFAGTFVRHPLALAASKASLTYMTEQGPQLQENLTRKTKRLAEALNAVLIRHQLPLYVAQFGSLWKIKFKDDILCGELLFTLMREKGIHIWDNFPCFLTEAHTDEEVDTIVRCFAESVQELIEGGIFSGAKPAVDYQSTATPPTPGARLGRDQSGNPAWFLPNPDQAGKYLKVELN